ncbi:MAG: hypothetical protein ACLP5H_24650 [Desulfomonilaceae bacterium]
MTRKRGGYRGDRVYVVKFRADEDLNATLQKLADANQSAKARVVREMVLYALSEGFRGSNVGTAQTQEGAV